MTSACTSFNTDSLSGCESEETGDDEDISVIGMTTPKLPLQHFSRAITPGPSDVYQGCWSEMTKARPGIAHFEEMDLDKFSMITVAGTAKNDSAMTARAAASRLDNYIEALERDRCTRALATYQEQLADVQSPGRSVEQGSLLAGENMDKYQHTAHTMNLIPLTVMLSKLYSEAMEGKEPSSECFFEVLEITRQCAETGGQLEDLYTCLRASRGCELPTFCLGPSPNSSHVVVSHLSVRDVGWWAANNQALSPLVDPDTFVENPETIRELENNV